MVATMAVTTALLVVGILRKEVVTTPRAFSWMMTMMMMIMMIIMEYNDESC